MRGWPCGQLKRWKKAFGIKSDLGNKRISRTQKLDLRVCLASAVWHAGMWGIQKEIKETNSGVAGQQRRAGSFPQSLLNLLIIENEPKRAALLLLILTLHQSNKKSYNDEPSHGLGVRAQTSLRNGKLMLWKKVLFTDCFYLEQQSKFKIRGQGFNIICG